MYCKLTLNSKVWNIKIPIISILPNFSRQCAPCLVPYDAIVKLEMNSEEAETILATHLKDYVSTYELLKWVHHTSGGSSQELRHRFFKDIPCSVMVQLSKHFQMDLDMFEYDTAQFMRMCRKAI